VKYNYSQTTYYNITLILMEKIIAIIEFSPILSIIFIVVLYYFVPMAISVIA